MSTALQVHSETMSDWQVMRQQAEMLVKTGFLPNSIKTPDQAVAIILTGRELGIGTMAALNSINVIAGKPTISPQLMLALINRTGELEDFSVADDGQACAVTMKRRGRKAHSEWFSMKDAALMKTTDGYGENKKTISLSEKYNWKQMPAIMRKWRAVAACARVVFPDVILGLYTPDEMGAVVEPESGEVVALPPEPRALNPINQSRIDELEPAGLEPPEDDEDIDREAGAGLGSRAFRQEKPTPEPVRMRVQGAQATNDKPVAADPMTRNLVALLSFLKWDANTLANDIHARFNGLGVSDTDAGLALEALSGVQKKALLQALSEEKAARTGGKR